jgi:hypothetical protein
MTLRQAHSDIIDDSGSVADAVPAATFHRRVAVVWREDQWVMYGMQ